MIYIDSINPQYFESTNKNSESREYSYIKSKVYFHAIKKDIEIKGSISIHSEEYTTMSDAKRLIKEHLLTLSSE